MQDDKQTIESTATSFFYTQKYWLFFVAGLVWMLYLCLSSDGVPLHDELAHFLISENAWQHPSLMLDLWGRSVKTILYMTPALGGLTTARLFSVFLSALIVLLTTEVARKSGVEKLYLIPLFLWFQPWFNDLSWTVLTETPFSFLLILGIYCWFLEKMTLAGLLFGLLPLVRHEGIALSGLWFVYMLYQKNWQAGIAAFLPLGLYNGIYKAALGSWPFEIFLEAKPTTLYGSGSWFHFFPRLGVKVGVPICLLALFSIKKLWEQRKVATYMAAYILYFLTHVVIFRFGLFASGGYSIFLLPVAPAFAIAAAIGAEQLWKILTASKNPFGRKYVPALFLIALLIVGTMSRPYKPDAAGRGVQAALNWLEKEGLAKNKMISTHPWLYYLADLEWQPGESWETPPPLNKISSGSLVIWDHQYSNRRGLSYEVLSLDKAEWQQLNSFEAGEIIIFRKR